MADTKTTDLTADTAVLPADVFPMVDSTGPTLKKVSAGTLHVPVTNYSTAKQGAGFSSDTYLTGSNIAFPAAPSVGTLYEAYFDVTKTAAGTATPVIVLRMGTAGTTADAAICTFTFGAGTAVADVAQVQVIASFRSVGSGTSAVVAGIAAATTNLTTTGWSNAKKTVVVVSSGFNSTTAGLTVGLSYNGGASASHTVQLVRSKLTLH